MVCLDPMPARPTPLWITFEHTSSLCIYLLACSHETSRGYSAWAPHAGGAQLCKPLNLGLQTATTGNGHSTDE